MRIIQEADPVAVERISLCIHGAPGVGKTSLFNTCDDPILLDFDGGVHRSKNRKLAWQFDTWDEVCKLDKSHFAPYKTVGIDTAGRMLELMSLDIMEKDAKMGRGGALSIQGYGRLKSVFSSWMALLKSYGKDIVLLCHSEEKQRGDDIVERLDVVGGSKNEIYKSCDVMGRLAVRDGKRTLNCNPDELAFGKSPGLPILEIPSWDADPKFMSKVIQQCKDLFNQSTEAQKPAIELQEKWRLKIADAMTVADVESLVAELASEDCSQQVRTTIKKMVSKAAEGRGIVYNRDKKAFEKVGA